MKWKKDKKLGKKNFLEHFVENFEAISKKNWKILSIIFLFIFPPFILGINIKKHFLF